MKKLFQKLHLVVGLTTGLVVLVVSTTGCLTSFEEELRGYFYSNLYDVKQENHAVKSIDEIGNTVKNQYPTEKIKAIRIKLDATSSVEVQFKNKLSVFVNPYSGKVLGSLVKENDFFGKVLIIHRTLYLGEAGKWITGISCLLFFFMLLSGIILWWPTGKKNRNGKFSIKKHTHKVKRNYDLHSVLGFYASWIILLTVITGLIWSFEWAEKSLFWITGSQKEPRTEIHSISTKESNPEIQLNQLYQHSKMTFNKHDECAIFLPEDSLGTIRVVMRTNKNGFLRKQDNLFYDQYSGKLLKSKSFDSLDLGTKLKMSNLKIHTGKSFGLLGQLLVFFASLICASLPITGFLIWRNKRKFIS